MTWKLARVLSLPAALLLAAAAAAQAPAPDRLRAVVDELSTRLGTRVLVDPAIPPAPSLQPPPRTAKIEVALTALTGQLRQVAWRRVHLSRNTPPDAEHAAGVARLLERQPAGILVESGDPKRSTACLKAVDAPDPARWELDRRPAYLLYSTAAADVAPTERQLRDLQEQQLRFPLKPEQEAGAMAGMVGLLGALGKDRIERLMTPAHAAAMRLWESTSAEDRRGIMQHALQSMSQFRGAAPAARPPAAPPNRLGQWKAAAAAAARSCDAEVLVEPGLYLDPPGPAPAGEPPIEKMLDALAAGSPEVTWRRLYLTPARARPLPGAERLAAEVRTLELPDCASLAASRQETDLYLHGRLDSPAVRKAGKFSDQPVYLLYRAVQAAGSTPEERFADLQRRQLDLLLRLNPDQLERSMEQVVQTYNTTAPASRGRLIALPTTAVLMGLWFPRDAKDRKESGAPP
jgi:hypothetical protein